MGMITNLPLPRFTPVVPKVHLHTYFPKPPAVLRGALKHSLSSPGAAPEDCLSWADHCLSQGMCPSPAWSAVNSVGQLLHGMGVSLQRAQAQGSAPEHPHSPSGGWCGSWPGPCLPRTHDTLV